MANYGDARLREMCDAEWDMLSRVERRAASKWMSDQVHDPTWSRTAEEIVTLSPTLTLNAAYSRAQRRLTPTPDPSAPEPVAAPSERHAYEAGTPAEPHGGLTFVDEPPMDDVRHEKGVWADISRVLKANRTRWAMVGVYPSRARVKQVERDVNHGRYQDLRPRGAFEARAVTVQGEHRLYMRAV